MIAQSLPPKLSSCGCCEMPSLQPMEYNKPGQPSLTYRLGTHETFLLGMLTDVRSRATLDQMNLHIGDVLMNFKIRSSDDPAVGLMDAWATVADVITFYQERIANEGYLRTATERRSVLELARAIGYELNPGVAASTFLAFTVEDAPGAPGQATVPKGTKVQSIPTQDKLPETFETGEDIVVRAEWNALRPRLTETQDLFIDKNGQTLYMLDYEGGVSEAQQLDLAGTNTGLSAGDLILITVRSGDSVGTLVKSIENVWAYPQLGITEVDLGDLTKAPSLPPAAVIPNAGLTSTEQVPFDDQNIRVEVLARTWNERDFKAFLVMNGWDSKALLQRASAIVVEDGKLPSDQGVFAFREHVGFFGNNAPYYYSLPESLRTALPSPPYGNPWDWDSQHSKWQIWIDPGQDPIKGYYKPADVYLERSVQGIATGSWLILETFAQGSTDILSNGANFSVAISAKSLQKPISRTRKIYKILGATESSLTGFTLSGKATGLMLANWNETGPLNDDGNDKPPSFTVRETTAYIRSERLELADSPIDDPVEGSEVMLDRMVLGLQFGQRLILSGERKDAQGVVSTELVVLSDITHRGGFTTLKFDKALKFHYIRKTVSINANVVEATNGETVVEVLGGGAASQANQSFVLNKPPLTYIPAPTSSGAVSTLNVHVNGQAWEEVPYQYGLDSRSRTFIVRLSDDGHTSVTFGNGETGSRLPSGEQNIVATYRSGIGPEGEVDAGSLTLLQTRHLGVRGVTNPLPATGAAARENIDQARFNAPLKVFTLDRIVSLQDFENFARAFAGIGKAQAAALWGGESRIVHITIAGANGKQVDQMSATYLNLRKAIDAARDTTQRQVRIANYQLLSFNVEANIVVDPAFPPDSVLGAVETALQQVFSFENRNFGQPVTAADVVTTIQNVPGVLATKLTKLYLVTDPTGPDQTSPRQILQSAKARWEGDDIQPAQLLLLNPAGIILVKMEEKP